ncbi:MAG: 50S ribosomal protein L4 [Patescibacteria group bacterium]
MKTELYNQKGERVGTYELPENIFGVSFNADTVHQAVVAHAANARMPIAHTKDRREVRGGGKKPWRQKGTGRARHGSIRSPLWRGGGITFGPRNDKNFSVKINKKQKQKALFMALSAKHKDAEMAVLDSLVFDTAKTKVFALALGAVAKAAFSSNRPKRTLVVVPTEEKNIVLSARNLPSVRVITARNLNAHDVLANKYLVLSKDSVPVIATTFTRVT